MQEEVFRGVAVPFTTGMLRDTIESQFHAMNRPSPNAPPGSADGPDIPPVKSV